ncbi:MAG: DUF4856 domain-containing protein [Flavobacteriia bacterium]|jgi:hypothetical protein
MKNIYVILALSLTFTSCKKEGCTDETASNFNKNAKKDDGSCVYDPAYVVPTTYSFADANGVSTVSYSGQTERLNQLREMVLYMKSGTSTTLVGQQLKDMFSNANGNGNGAFTFTSTKQLKDKCFELDQTMFEKFMDSIAVSSASFGQAAANGQAGVLTTADSKTYLFNRNGVEYLQIIEKGLMGAVFMNQALNSYFSEAKMNVDNSSVVAGTNYTTMEHHWDEAFGYFGVDVTFPTVIPTDFWGKYSNSQNATLGSNKIMMDNFLKGRAAIVNDVYADRDVAIVEIKKMWENVSAYSAMQYLTDASSSFGTDQAKFLHVVSEAYAFTLCLRYAPLDTRRLSNAELDAILAKFGTNFWNLTLSKINEIKADLDAKY